MREQKGFTLLEMLTTVGVAAVLVSTAVPGLQAVTSNSKQTSAVNELISGIHVARSTAITQNSSVSVCASADGQSCGGAAWQDGMIVFRDINANQMVDGEDVIVSIVGPMEQLSIKPTSVGNAMTYRPNGRTTLPANGVIVGSLTVCDDRGNSHAKTIVIDLAGRPQAKSGDGASC